MHYSNNYWINRREFIASTLGILAVALPGCGGKPETLEKRLDVPSSVPETRTADSIIALRQQKLNELVQKYGSRTVESIVYDHDKSIIRERVPTEYAKEFVSDQVINSAKETVLRREDLSKEQKDRFIALLNSPQARSQLEQEARERAKANLEKYIQNAQGITPYNTKDFGLGKKSTIYMPSTAFDGRTVIMGDGTRVTYSPDVALNVRVRHEIFHAEGNFDGMDFGDGFVVNSSNFNSLRREIKDFANEFNAHFNTYEFFKKEGAKDEIVVAVDYFKNAVGRMFNETISPLANSGILSDFEHRLVYFLSEKWNSLLPELAPIVKEPVPK